MSCWSPARATRPARPWVRQVIPFSDHDAVAAALKQEAKLWLNRSGPWRDRRRHAAARCSAAPATPVSGFSIDSRSLAPGEAFVAIRGPNRDGHAFVAAALEGGAACAIVERRLPGAAVEERLVRVGDTLEALNDLGRAARARAKDAVVIAVTGSAGKTGTKEALRLALAPSGSVHASAKSFNNHWGVPLSLANMPRDMRFGVFEIGMNHAGEIDALTRLVRPAYRHRHHSGAGPSRLLPLGRGDRRRQGRNLPRARARRHGDHQSRQSLIPSGSKDHALAHGATHRRLRRSARRRCAARRRRARARRLGRQRRHPRARRSATASARRAATWCRIRSPCWRRRSSPAPISLVPPARSPCLHAQAGRAARAR